MGGIRPYRASDRNEWHRMRTALWPEQTEADMNAWLARADATIFVAEEGHARLRGFAEVAERPYANGCDTSPVAYLEGWYVDPAARRQGVGTALVRAVESWARSRGHRELASDTGLDNPVSQGAHERLGFTETERLVLYRKAL